MRYLEAMWNWSLEKDWRTWLMHFILAFVLSLVFSGWAVMTFYLLREIEQVWETHQRGEVQNWLDHFMDFASPFLACGLTTLL